MNSISVVWTFGILLLCCSPIGALGQTRGVGQAMTGERHAVAPDDEINRSKGITLDHTSRYMASGIAIGERPTKILRINGQLDHKDGGKGTLRGYPVFFSGNSRYLNAMTFLDAFGLKHLSIR